MKNFLLLLSIISGKLIETTQGAVCASSATVGENNPRSNGVLVDSSTGLSLLLTSTIFAFTCEGKVESWVYYAKDNTGTIYFQVWRDTGTTWSLVGQNAVTVTGGEVDNENTYTVPANEQISVITNDVVAVYTPNNPILSYKSAGGSTYTASYTTSITSPTVGSTTYAWGSAPTHTARRYALRVELEPDTNSAPVISNLPLGSALSVPENTGLGTSVFQVSVTDVDSGDTHTYTASYSPSSGSTLFTISSSTGIVSTVSSDINYETLSPSTSFDITVTASDGSLTDSQVLQIDVTDVNEAPSFGHTRYTISGDEGTAGSSIGTPSFVVTDPDTGDTHSYSIDCSAFTMDPTTGAVTFTADYDVDSGAATSVTCTATVSDGQLTDTTLLAITINDINDNTPQFSTTSYMFTIYYGSSIGTTIGTIEATDMDVGAYGVLTYALDQSSLAEQYFGVTNAGILYVNTGLLSFTNETMVSFTATASDPDGQSDSVNIFVNITLTATSTILEYKTFFDDERNIAWFTITLLLICGLVGVIVLLVYRGTDRNTCFNLCKEKPKTRTWSSYSEVSNLNRRQKGFKSSSTYQANTNVTWNAWNNNSMF